ncbi:MAG TPA: amino acid adenylation domain-containing protein [Candidatus Deferrimicrobium sp.]|nr:amino acid adenylation domain-containing protein [Candidatus Deferrimicrobium sp.]
MAKLMMHWGVQPHAMIGYSFGEYVAACLAGVFSLEDILKLLAVRGKLISELPAGSMLSVPLPSEDVLSLLPKELSLAIDNGSSCVVSGPDAAVELFAREMKENKVLTTPFASPYAGHSQMLEPVLAEFKKEVAKITLNAPQIPYISTVTGTWITIDDARSPGYWAKQLSATVYFVQGIRKILEETQPLFLEIGPGRDMSALVNREIEDKKTQWALNLVKHHGIQKETSDEYYLLDKIGRLWLYGINIDWQAFHGDYPGPNRTRVSLPTYPFERQRYGKIIDDYRTGKYYYLKGAPGYLSQEMQPLFIQEKQKQGGQETVWYERPQLSTQYLAPQNEIEQALVKIWQHLFGIERIGIKDDFFELGGDSLKAINVLAHLHKETNRLVPLNYFFDNPTIKQVAAYSEDEKNEFVSIQPQEKKEYYPLSSAQKRMYFFQQVDAGSIAYNNVLANSIAGDIDTEKLSTVFKKLIARHEGLRTSFSEINGEWVQRIHDSVEFEITGSGKDDLIKNFIRPFDLSQAPLLRVGLLKQILIVDMHHIISDGTSLAVLIEEFMMLYQGEELAALPLQYKDYAAWQNREKEGVLSRQQEFWLAEFAGEIPVLDLPYDYARPLNRSFSGKTLTFAVGREETSALNQMASNQGATLYMALLCLTGIFLTRLSGEETVVIGTPIAGRTHAELGRIIGMFVNTLAMKIEPVGEKTVLEFLIEVKEKALNAFANQDYPYEELVEHLAVDRNNGRNPLFDMLFALQNVPIDSIAVPGLNLKPYPYEQGIAKFDLSFQCFENDGTLSFTFEYSTELFKDETAAKWAGYFKKILAAVVENPTEKIAGIELISKAEKEQVLLQFNDTASAYPADKTIPQLFAEQATQTPDRIALAGHVGLVRPVQLVQLTYRHLNEQSGQSAGWLIAKGVLADDIVGIMMERSVEMIIGIMGILKAGGAYLPIAPGYPEERIAYMLKDSNAKITIENIRAGMPFHHSAFITHHSSHLAYIIYTSGSTGQPKGVMVTHRNVVRLVKNTNYIDFAGGDSILQTGAMEFDASTFEVWGALLNGLKLVLANKETILTPGKLKTALRQYDIDTIWMTSPLFNQMLQEDIEIFVGLKNLLVGGDVLSPPHIARLKSKYPGLNVINGYGPTENTTFSTTFSISGDYRENIPIGKPIANSTAYIVDKYNHLQPIGIPGELLVGGDGVARGYLNNPELTNIKFKIHHAVLYCTGDLARWLADGNIEFLGRIDQQVKIRGFRVEPGEIENYLLKHEQIKNAAVTVKGDEEKNLAAYIVPAITLSDSELREYLSKYLPDYMIPAHFIQLAGIPLTANKKVDFPALPEPGIKTGPDFTEPVDDTEKRLAEIWAHVLKIEKERIGIDSNFFALGGHSLKATFLAAHIHKEMKASVPLMEIFHTPTIRGLVTYIKSTRQVAPDLIEPIEKMEYYEPSAVQKRLIALQRQERETTVYNIPLIMIIEGKPDEKKLAWTFERLIDRHESLRTSFHIINGNPVQRIHDRVDFAIEHYDLSPKNTNKPKRNEQQMIKDFVRPFDLSLAPLMRVGLLKTKNKTLILMIDMHHIITDGSSQAILINEFPAIYLGKELPPPRIQHKDYTKWQLLQRTGPRMKQLENYWFNAFKGDYPVLELPYDFPRPLEPDYSGGHIDFVLESRYLQGLRKMGDAVGATLFMMLLAIFNILLAKLSGRDDIVVGTPTAGRKHADLENISGLFVSSLALRNNPGGEKTFRDFLNDVKERTAADFEHQDYPVEDLLKKVNENRTKSLGHLYNVMLVLQNMEDPEIVIPGLTMKPYPVQNDTAKYELVLICSEKDGQMFYTFEYSTRLFKHESILRFEFYFKNIILAVLENPDQRLGEITARLKEK